MINLNALADIWPGPFFSKETLFYELDEAAAFGPDTDFDISFVDHIQYGPIRNVVRAEVIYVEDGYRSERIWFAWDEWTFSLIVNHYGVDHDCPSCVCADNVDYYSAIREALDEVTWNLN